tara:strand:+ start:231 stop:443 length:213 start_codon:yes stop_codon:yes gene_type:complete
MFKFFFIFILFLLLNNCSAPGLTFLGPAFTGATTKSAAKTTMSYGSKQVMKKIARETKNQKNKDLLYFDY